MRKFLFLLSIWALLVSGCTFLPQPPDVEKITGPKVENPFFKIPPENLKDYQDRSWILLAESSTKNWFYDPYTLTEDEDNILTFDAYHVPLADADRLQPFNATMVGPYRQKIDCFNNYQWSEIFYAQNMPRQETLFNPQNPKQEWGWIQIKPKTSMAYIRTRLCGRKFLDEANINFFLFQEVRMEQVLDNASGVKGSDLGESSKKSKAQRPIFYEVIDNEVLMLDQRKNIRQIVVEANIMDKTFTKQGQYIFQASCNDQSFAFYPKGKSGKTEVLSAVKSDLPNVAFNRACGNHGSYMKIIFRRGRQ